MSDLTINQQLAIEQQCIRLVLDAAHYSDEQAYDRLADLFLEDGLLYRPTTPDPIKGRSQIIASYNSRPAHRLTRHLCTNFRVDIQSETSVRVRCYAQVFAADTRKDEGGHFGPPLDSKMMIGEFDDLCVSKEGQWYIAERRASFAMHMNVPA